MKIQLEPLQGSYRCGGTPHFATAHLSIAGTMPATREEWPLLLAMSVRSARRLSRDFADGEVLGKAADLVSGRSDLDPMSGWIAALERAFRIPAYPSQREAAPDGRFQLYLGSPYPKATAVIADLARHLLFAGARAASNMELPLEPAFIGGMFAAVAAELPTPELMEFHAALTAQDAMWRWAPRQGTRLGYGSRQKVVARLPDNPKALARQIARLNLAIPIYTVTGSLGKTSTVRLLGQLLETSGLRVGLAASDGGWVGGRRVMRGDCIGGDAAEGMLARPDVDVGVFEVGRGGILRQGIPYPRSDVAILLNVGEIHIGMGGVDSVEKLADVKAETIRRARLAVLNRHDAQCLRIGGQRDAATCVWFGARLDAAELAAISAQAHGALGVERDPADNPLRIAIWSGGQMVSSLSLDGVRPYQGLLGEKTIEELLAATAAAYFGPVKTEDLNALLPRLSLNAANHPFRTSVHPCGNVVFVLDKAQSLLELETVAPALEEICRKYKIDRRICAVARSAEGRIQHLYASAARLHQMMDEFICYDRPDDYGLSTASPDYVPGSIPSILKKEIERLDEITGSSKTISLAENWAEAERIIRDRLRHVDRPVLMLIIQPIMKDTALNERILSFISRKSDRA